MHLFGPSGFPVRAQQPHPDGVTPIFEEVGAAPTAGLDRPMGSIAKFGALYYIKNGSATTAWILVSDIGSSSLQEIYTFTTSGIDIAAINIPEIASTDDILLLRMRLLNSSGSPRAVTLQPNGLTTNQKTAWNYGDGTATLGGGTTTTLFVGNAGDAAGATLGQLESTIWISPKVITNAYRLFSFESSAAYISSDVRIKWFGTCLWENTATVMSSLNIAFPSANIKAGSTVAIYRVAL